MVTSSDIPEWSLAECGFEYNLNRPIFVDEVQHQKLFKDSPSSLIDNVKTPTLLLIGHDDRRVNKGQGLSWFHALKGRGVETKLLIFPDVGHSLDTLDADRYGIEAAFKFFKR